LTGFKEIYDFKLSLPKMTQITKFSFHYKRRRV